MKRFTGVNFYELLEVPSSASMEEIRRAYEMAKQTYADNSMVTYSLFDSQSRKQIIERIEEAFSTLRDEGRRYAYDVQIGIKQDRGEPVKQDKADGGPAKEATVASTRTETPGKKPSSRRPEAAPGPGRQTIIREDEISGKFLKEIREKQGIPLQEIADNTRINITYLEYIERENFKTLPAEVYLKGYLEQYAGYLGIDPAVLISGYLRLFREWKEKKEAI